MAGLCEGGNEPPGSLKAKLFATGVALSAKVFACRSEECINAIKISSYLSTVRSVLGRSFNTIRCRHPGCNETETLGHVLGFCRKTELLRNDRHHKARTGIADVLKRRGWEVYEELHCVSSLDSNRRADIVAIHRTQSKGIVLDPTIRFERDALQAQHVDVERKSIYESCIPYLSEKYNIPTTIFLQFCLHCMMRYIMEKNSIPHENVNVFFLLLHRVALAIRRNTYFTHDGASAHFSVNVRRFLNKRFIDRQVLRLTIIDRLIIANIRGISLNSWTAALTSVQDLWLKKPEHDKLRSSCDPTQKSLTGLYQIYDVSIICQPDRSRLVPVAWQQWSEMEALIPSPAACEVRSVIKFFNAQSIAPIEIHRQLCQVYGPNIMSKQMVRRWCKQFSEGRQSVHDEERSGRPSLINDDRVELMRQSIMENRRFTITELSSHFLQISRSLLHEIVTKHLLFKKVVPGGCRKT
ncbi:hypothetical protein ANN_07622 [Periplaneta americana]|uniref:Mos1 transposase HTH domain-containing protein n=1 Tax=Periplaneta americana TaxID=6978 RepID=A0ABQ8SZ45_PERAM|nr:hypothetical protein ANN_07622 [Periplaneta americana]